MEVLARSNHYTSSASGWVILNLLKTVNIFLLTRNLQFTHMQILEHNQKVVLSCAFLNMDKLLSIG